MIKLSNVTLLALSSIEIPATLDALKKSCEKIDFGDVKIISHEKPNNLPKFIDFEQCPKINDIMDFNIYTFSYLHKHVKTSHCLMIQYHGFVTNPELWEDSWLQYDYIGAPWAYKDDAYICHDTGEHIMVGNGGFSLRSLKLMQAPSKHKMPLLQEQGWANEDGNLCVYHRVKMLQLGIKYAPVEVAAIFSYENPVPENQGLKTFGYHRHMNPNG